MAFQSATLILYSNNYSRTFQSSILNYLQLTDKNNSVSLVIRIDHHYRLQTNVAFPTFLHGINISKDTRDEE